MKLKVFYNRRPFMQIKRLHINIYKLNKYVSSESSIEKHRKLYQKSIDLTKHFWPILAYHQGRILLGLDYMHKYRHQMPH